MTDSASAESKTCSDMNAPTPNSTVDLDFAVASVCGFIPANDNVDTSGNQRFKPDGVGLPSGDFHKLDVLNSQQINRMVFCIIGVWGVCIAYTLILGTLASTTWRSSMEIQNLSGPIFVATTTVPAAVEVIDGIIRTFSFFVLLTISLCFSIRVLFRENVRPTERQIFVIGCLWANVFATFPLVLVWLNSERELFYSDWLIKHMNIGSIIWSLRMVGGTSLPLAFIWCSAAMYANLDDERPPFFRRNFYIPKLTALLVYQLFSISIMGALGLRVPFFPLSTLVGFLSVSASIGSIEMTSAILVAVLSSMELALLFCIILQVHQTRKAMQGVDKLRYRTKRNGFYFILYHVFVSHMILTLLDVALNIFVPKPYASIGWLVIPRRRILISDSCRAGIEFLNCTYLIIAAYVSLPADSDGFRGWFCSGYHDQLEEESYATITGISGPRPLSVSARELRDDRKALDVQYKYTLVAETMIQMFNFSWLVEVFENSPEVLDELAFHVKKQVSSAETSTRAIVTSGVDRIVIAFEGPSNVKNIHSGMDLKNSKLIDFVPSKDTIMSLHPVMDQRIWKNAKLLEGIKEAYLSISKELVETLEEMLEEKQRTLFCTGHSLGGAIASIAALDLRLSLGIADDEISLISFGSPKFLDANAAAVLDILVPLHWRIRMDRDIVPNLPVSGYAHAGRCASLAVDGAMKIEQSVLELVVSKRQAMSTSLHKKGVYLLAIKAFCVKYLNDFEPKFWDFTVYPDEFTDSVRDLNIPGLEDLVCHDAV